MSSLPAIALSGMHAAQAGLGVAAHNIANAHTVGFRRQQAVQRSDVNGGTSATVRQADDEGPSIETDVVAQLQARNAFLANLAVFKAHDRMTGALLDTLG